MNYGHSIGRSIGEKIEVARLVNVNWLLSLQFSREGDGAAPYPPPLEWQPFSKNELIPASDARLPSVEFMLNLLGRGICLLVISLQQFSMHCIYIYIYRMKIKGRSKLYLLTKYTCNMNYKKLYFSFLFFWKGIGFFFFFLYRRNF